MKVDKYLLKNLVMISDWAEINDLLLNKYRTLCSGKKII